MSKEEKKPQGAKPQTVAAPQAPQKAEGPSHCKMESCKKKPEKFGFCMEHYELYMAGVIRGDGQKPIDFEEKLSLHLRRKQKQAA